LDLIEFKMLLKQMAILDTKQHIWMDCFME